MGKTAISGMKGKVLSVEENMGKQLCIYIYERDVFLATSKATGERVAMKQHKIESPEKYGVGALFLFHSS